MEDSVDQEATRDRLGKGQIVPVGTDGIWKTRNSEDQKYGKDRLPDGIRAHRDEPTGRISEAITDALKRFRGDAHQDNDVTFVLVKLT
jgi:phosphoserine phosphatase RsbU/P